MGFVQLELRVDPTICELSWLNKHKLVGSTYHQCVKGRLDQIVVMIPTNLTLFDET